MKNILLLSLLLGFFISTSNATPIGPTYPAPGGNSFSGSGNGTEGGATWNYSGFNTSGLDALYFGLNQVDFGANGAGLDGIVNPFVFSGIAGDTATWLADTLWFESTGLTSHISAETRLTMTVSGLGATPWITDLASIGLDNIGVFGTLGAVVDNSAGNDFTLNWEIEANTGSGWQNLNGPSGVQQHQSHDGATRSSFATGFYSEASVISTSVPEPSTLAIFALGMIGLASRRFKKQS